MNEGLWFIVDLSGPNAWSDLEFWSNFSNENPGFVMYVDYEFQSVWFKVQLP